MNIIICFAIDDFVPFALVFLVVEPELPPDLLPPLLPEPLRPVGDAECLGLLFALVLVGLNVRLPLLLLVAPTLGLFRQERMEGLLGDVLDPLLDSSIPQFPPLISQPDLGRVQNSPDAAILLFIIIVIFILRSASHNHCRIASPDSAVPPSISDFFNQQWDRDELSILIPIVILSVQPLRLAVQLCVLQEARIFKFLIVVDSRLKDLLSPPLSAASVAVGILLVPVVVVGTPASEAVAGLVVVAAAAAPDGAVVVTVVVVVQGGVVVGVLVAGEQLGSLLLIVAYNMKGSLISD